jgi:hypothetical protein
MVNYFFISSPLHFFVATNIAIQQTGDENIALFISKNKQTTELYSGAITNDSAPFSRVVLLPVNDTKNKVANRKKCFSLIETILEQTPADQIFTGNDARIEFQFAMHVTRKKNNKVTGIYFEDGLGSYLPHRSMSSFTRQYLETFIKNLTYGNWWKSPLSLGGSQWISEAYLAYPKLAHQYLAVKNLHKIDDKVFESSTFIDICDRILQKQTDNNKVNFDKIKIIICLTHESIYLDYEKTLLQLKAIFKDKYLPNDIAIKSHPRSKLTAPISKAFPQATILPSKVGLELFLPHINNNTLIVGDISTTLLTTKWLKPNVKVGYFEAETKSIDSKGLLSIFNALSIKCIK